MVWWRSRQTERQKENDNDNENENETRRQQQVRGRGRGWGRRLHESNKEGSCLFCLRLRLQLEGLARTESNRKPSALNNPQEQMVPVPVLVSVPVPILRPRLICCLLFDRLLFYMYSCVGRGSSIILDLTFYLSFYIPFSFPFHPLYIHFSSLFSSTYCR